MAGRRTPPLTLDRQQEQAAIEALKRFLDERFELSLGSFEVMELLELINQEIAPHYYNQAILAVQTHLKERFESIESDLWALEKA